SSAAGPATMNWQLLPPVGAAMLDRLTRLDLLSHADRATFLEERLDRLREDNTEEPLGHALIQAGLLTQSQLARVRLATNPKLATGTYRLLAESGRGGMGTVYRAEHRLMKRKVAVKVLPLDDDCPVIVRQRFCAEMQVLADLSHPNVVLALDASELPAQGEH